MSLLAKSSSRFAVIAPFAICLFISAAFTAWFGISLARLIERTELTKQSESIGLLTDYIQHLVDDMLVNGVTLSDALSGRSKTPSNEELAALRDEFLSASHIRALALFDRAGNIVSRTNDMADTLEAELPQIAARLATEGEPIFLPLAGDDPQGQDIPRFATVLALPKVGLNLAFEVSSDGRKQRAANLRATNLDATLAMYDTVTGAVVTFGGAKGERSQALAASWPLQEIQSGQHARCIGNTVFDRQCIALRTITHSSLILAGLVDRDEIYSRWIEANRPFWIFASLVIAGGAVSSALIYVWATRRREDREQLRAALDNVKRLYAAKSNFMAHMSHELRTPLNSIIGFSDVMRNAFVGPLGARYREYAEDIHAAASHLHEIASDIMDAERVERGELALEPGTANLSAVTAEGVRILSVLAEKQNVAIIFGPGDPGSAAVAMNRHRVAQIVLNLLSNAVKYSEPGDTVHVSIERTPEQLWSLVVADEGIGMTPEEIAFSERPFGLPAERRSGRHDSVGLGLPIVRGLLQAAGGRLVIRSEKAKGTTVTAVFPSEQSVGSSEQLSAAVASDPAEAAELGVA